MTDVIDWPADLRPTTIEFWPEQASRVSESPFTFATQAIGFGGERWVAALGFSPLDRSRANRVRALLSRMQGGLVEVQAHHHQRRFAQSAQLLKIRIVGHHPLREQRGQPLGRKR